MLHVILGSDRALAKKALEVVLAEADSTGFDTDRLDAASSSFDAIFAAVTAIPFFGTRRVIVLSNMLSQSAGKSGRGNKGKSESDLSRLITSVPESTTLVLFDPELSDVNATIRKQLPSDIDLSINEAPRGSALIELTQQMATAHESSIDRRTAQMLLDRLFPGYWPQAPQNRAYDKPPSVEQLGSEIAKLSLAAYPDAITTSLVEELVESRSEERVFPLLDAVIGGNQRGALSEVDNAHRAGEESSRLMNQIYQQIELSAAALASGRPSDPSQTGRALGVNNAWRMKRITESAQRARTNPARQLRLAIASDRKLKTGRLRNPDEALLDLVVQVTTHPKSR